MVMNFFLLVIFLLLASCCSDFDYRLDVEGLSRRACPIPIVA